MTYIGPATHWTCKTCRRERRINEGEVPDRCPYCAVQRDEDHGPHADPTVKYEGEPSCVTS